MKKVTFRNIYIFDIASEINKGNQVRILDRLLEKIYKADNMTAIEYINIVESRDYERYVCWVVEAENDKEDLYVTD